MATTLTRDCFTLIFLLRFNDYKMWSVGIEHRFIGKKQVHYLKVGCDELVSCEKITYFA